jgi:phosphoribosylformimino-5-aminoimidazole carboxamide ribotide isomerase
MELLPAIDLRNQRVVRLRQGEFAAEKRYPTTAVKLCKQYAAAGARRVHLVDLDAARDGTIANTRVLRSLAGLKLLRIQAGGGVRRLADVVRLLDAGADRVVTGSVAAETPDLVADWIARYGAHRIVAAFDVRLGTDDTPVVAIQGWQRNSKRALWDIVTRFAWAGLKHALCTDIGRDGTLAGPNLKLYRECVARFPTLAWQASGGVRHAADLRALARTGVASAITGKALIEGRIPKRELVPFFAGA